MIWYISGQTVSSKCSQPLSSFGRNGKIKELQATSKMYVVRRKVEYVFPAVVLARRSFNGNPAEGGRSFQPAP